VAANSKIEWTEATWNPIVGCSIVSPGCTNCYAMKMAARLEAMFAGTSGATHYRGTTKKVNGNAVWTGQLALAPETILTEPLRRKKPTTYFVNSMGDLFHEAVAKGDIDRVFAVMALCPQHTFQVLTKRAARMRDYMTSVTFGRIDAACLSLKTDKPAVAAHTLFKNVWLGVSCERQQEADERIPLLLQTPAAIRFISAEPLLGPINLTRINTPGNGLGWFDAFASPDHCLDWVIVGGESGRSARPMHPQWARDICDQCEAAGVPFFFKQWGEWAPGLWSGAGDPAHFNPFDTSIDIPDLSRHDAWANRVHWFDPDSAPDGLGALKLGKKIAGRRLGGVEHNGFPQASMAVKPKQDNRQPR
jgi:protein gp37